MTPLFRTLLALPLALPLLACEAGSSEDAQFRATHATEEPDTTARFGSDQSAVRVKAYAVNDALAESFEAEGFDALLIGAEALDTDGALALRVDGVAPLDVGALGDRFVQLGREDERAEYPFKQFNFTVHLSSSGTAVTEFVFDASSNGSHAEPGTASRFWYEDAEAIAPPVAASVEGIEYEWVAVDGTTTTCRAEATLTPQTLFGFTQVEGADGRFEFDIADECAEVLRSAAQRRPPAAFFVRCDRTTTTLGIHRVTDITLKRGVVRASGELFVGR